MASQANRKPTEKKFDRFPTRGRSVVHSIKGIVSTSSPQATDAGLRILRAGGNAADAAVAVAAAINVADPPMTGIGGDMFCLYYDAKVKKVHSLNGSGHSPAGASLEDIIRELGIDDPVLGQIPAKSVHGITTPGAAKGWVETVRRFGSGRLSLEQILGPAIEMAEEGIPVNALAAHVWAMAEKDLLERSKNGHEVLKRDPASPNGYRAPNEGETIRNPNLARTLRLLAEKGVSGFYEGPVAESIISTLHSMGGYHTLDDLKYHAHLEDTDPEPLSVRLRDDRTIPPTQVDLWEHSPNGQGLVALLALGIMRELETSSQIPPLTPSDHNSTHYLHLVIESLRLAFADAVWYISDPNFTSFPYPSLLTPSYLRSRAALFDPSRAASPASLPHGSPAHRASDTVYFAVTDPEGNACSFINSVSDKFGSCVVAEGTGFALQNRGTGFRLDAAHPDVYAPRKRPYHTIIPGMMTGIDGGLEAVFGVMGGAMQPQGHVQVVMNLLRFGLDPQEALDAPRVCVSVELPGKRLETGDAGAGVVLLEDGIPEDVVRGLRELGHEVEVVKGFARSNFGRGQIIVVNHDPVTGERVYSAGSDGRGDGAAGVL